MGLNTPLYQICSLFLDDEGRKNLTDRYNNPGLRYGDVKKELAEVVIEYFKPYRDKREDLLNNLDYVKQVLKKGAQKASVEADKYLNRAREAMGLNYAG